MVFSSLDLLRFLDEASDRVRKLQTDELCPSAAARYKENISWMPLHLDIPFMVYQADRRGTPETVPHKHSNSGREASAFLMFIAEYYDCLPEVHPVS